jgi:peptidoglycan hydrolase-like protein with peptidoglycan-binding domain
MQRALSAAAVVALVTAGMAGAAAAQSSYSPSTPGATAPRTPGPTTGQAPGMNPSAGTATRESMSSATSVASPDQIKEAQQQLKQKGFYQGQVDGRMGPETEAALRRFQQSSGLPATAQLDAKTMERLSGGSSEMGSGSSGTSSHMSPSTSPGGSRAPATPGMAPSTSPGAGGTTR